MTQKTEKLEPSWGTGVERLSALSTSTSNATWDHKDCSMLLRIFCLREPGSDTQLVVT